LMVVISPVGPIRLQLFVDCFNVHRVHWITSTLV
jgi:hypothetical protein